MCLTIVGVDITNNKVLTIIDDEEVEISIDKTGKFNRSGQKGNNDGFEAYSKIVDTVLKKKEIE